MLVWMVRLYRCYVRANHASRQNFGRDPPKFMPKIRKIVRAIAEKMRYGRTYIRTNGRTNEHEFIGPFSILWGTNNSQSNSETDRRTHLGWIMVFRTGCPPRSKILAMPPPLPSKIPPSWHINSGGAPPQNFEIAHRRCKILKQIENMCIA